MQSATHVWRGEPESHLLPPTAEWRIEDIIPRLLATVLMDVHDVLVEAKYNLLHNIYRLGVVLDLEESLACALEEAHLLELVTSDLLGLVGGCVQIADWLDGNIYDFVLGGLGSLIFTSTLGNNRSFLLHSLPILSLTTFGVAWT